MKGKQYVVELPQDGWSEEKVMQEIQVQNKLLTPGLHRIVVGVGSKILENYAH